MHIGYLWDKSDNIDGFLRGCSETERLRMFRQYCYERRVLKDNPDAEIQNKDKFKEIGAVFKKMGYRDCF